MNQLQAMRDTVAKMEEGLDWVAGGGDQTGDEKMHIASLDPDLQPEHIRDMLRVMEADNNPQHPGERFGEAKLGRWLGWAQAAVVAQGLMTLNDMKEINKRNADPSPPGLRSLDVEPRVELALAIGEGLLNPGWNEPKFIETGHVRHQPTQDLPGFFVVSFQFRLSLSLEGLLALLLQLLNLPVDRFDAQSWHGVLRWWQVRPFGSIK